MISAFSANSAMVCVRPQVVSLIEMGASDQAIADYLLHVETETIGVASGLDLRSVATRLRIAVAEASHRAT